MGFPSTLFTFVLLVSATAQAADETSSYHSEAAMTKAVEFAPGIISTPEAFEINTVFTQSGDNVIFARCDDGFTICTMMSSDYEDGKWQPPVVLPFSGQYLDADPYYNQDDSAMYFVSKRPIVEGGKPTEFVNIWRVTRQGENWSAPEYMANLSSDQHDLYPSVTDSGDVYFPSFRNGLRQMYVAKMEQGQLQPPVALPAHIYGENANIGDSAMSRDGKSIIFSISDRSDSLGRGDLYISTLENGRWSVAKSLGEKVNTPDHEFTPILSPDGEYLFFTRIENGRGNLYQIHLSALLN